MLLVSLSVILILKLSSPQSMQIKHFTKNDVVIVCGGTQKINNNDSNLGLRYLTHFAFSSRNTNVTAICAAQ